MANNHYVVLVVGNVAGPVHLDGRELHRSRSDLRWMKQGYPLNDYRIVTVTAAEGHKLFVDEDGNHLVPWNVAYTPDAWAEFLSSQPVWAATQGVN